MTTISETELSEIDAHNRQFERHIFAMSDFDRRCFLWRQRRFNRRRLYKYRTLNANDEMSVARLNEILVSSTLWFASPSTFNDPFDMAVRLDFAGTPSERRAAMQRLVKRQKPSAPWKKREAIVNNLMQRPVEHWRAFVQETYDKVSSAFGVCSFAGDPKSILMWSHYADHHSGICLQFESHLDPLLLRAISVEYSSTFPIDNWVQDPFHASGMDSSIVRKHLGWQYEKESRILRARSANTTAHFRPEALTAVILGCRIADDSEELLRQLLEDRYRRGLPKVAVYRATKHASKYKLNVIKC